MWTHMTKPESLNVMTIQHNAYFTTTQNKYIIKFLESSKDLDQFQDNTIVTDCTDIPV